MLGPVRTLTSPAASEAKRGSGRPLGAQRARAGLLRRERRGRGQGQQQAGEAAGQAGRSGHAADPCGQVVSGSRYTRALARIEAHSCGPGGFERARAFC